MLNPNKAVKKLEKMLSRKQNNGTIKNISEEILFLGGGISMIHEFTKHKNKNPELLECMPPKYFASMFSKESINNFKYREGK